MQWISRYWVVIACSVLATLYVLHNESDLISGLFGILWSDEGAYLLSAKSKVLFGQAHLIPTDGWRPEYIAPLLHRYGLLTILPNDPVWLVRFGMGLQVLLGQLLVARLAARYHGHWRAGAQCMLVLMLNPLLFFYARIGLSEGMQFLLVAINLNILYALWHIQNPRAGMGYAVLSAAVIALVLVSKITSLGICVGMTVATLVAIGANASLRHQWRMVAVSGVTGLLVVGLLYWWWIDGATDVWVRSNFGVVYNYYAASSTGDFLTHVSDYLIGLPYFLSLMPILILGLPGLFMAADRRRGFLWLLWVMTMATLAVEAPFGGELRRSFFGLTGMMILAGFTIGDYLRAGIGRVVWNRCRMLSALVIGLKVAGALVFTVFAVQYDDTIYTVLGMTWLALATLVMLVRGERYRMAYPLLMGLLAITAMIPILYQSLFSPYTVDEAERAIEAIVPEDATVTGILAGWYFQGLRRQIIFTDCVPQGFTYANDIKTLPADRRYFHMITEDIKPAIASCYPAHFENYTKVATTPILNPYNKGAGWGGSKKWLWRMYFRLYEPPATPSPTHHPAP